MTKAHFDAIEALVPEDVTVYRGSAPIVPDADEFPYVVLGGSPGRLSTEGLGRNPDGLNLRVRVTYAALSFDSILITVQKVRAALAGTKIVVPGWNTDPLEQTDLVDITTDSKVSVPVIDLHPVFAVDEYTAFSTR